jgi:pyruvate-formate lyase-activating enzyme
VKICPYPWLGLHFLTNGEQMVCPASQSSPSKGLTGERWSDASGAEGPRMDHLRNSQKLKSLRSAMMGGDLPPEFCSRCLSEESAGLDSWRQKNASSFRYTEESLLKATSSDGEIRDLPLQQLSLRMSNRCNLQCQMCHPNSSRSLYPEWLATESPRFAVGSDKVHLQQTEGGIHEDRPRFDWFESFFAALQADEKSLEGIDFIHFSGGEPLLERRHLEFLEYLIRIGRAPHTTLDYTSNLTVLPPKLLEIWRQFQKVRISVSWDGRRGAQEYIRFPLRYERFVENVRALDRAEGPYELWINSTISVLNVWDYPLFLKEVLMSSLQKFNVREGSGGGKFFFLSFHLLRKPDIFSLDLVSPKGRDLLVQHYEQHLPELRMLAASRFQSCEGLNELLPGLLKSISARPEDPGRIAQGEALWQTLSKRDAFRGCSYQRSIPELSSLVAGPQ